MAHFKFPSTKEALDKAKELSKNEKTQYASVILCEQFYYVDDDVTMIRPFEELIAEFENGKRTK